MNIDISKLLHIPSPYLFTPIQVTAAPLGSLMAELYFINEYDSNNPYWKTPIGSRFLTYQRYVVAQFWRNGYNSKFVGLQVPRQPKALRLMVEAEVELWEVVLKLLERMQTLCFLWNHPTVLLGQIISEKALVMANLNYVEQGEISGGTEWLKNLQSQNRILHEVSNPFIANKSPTTYRIIQKAVEMANILDGFRKEYYMAVVKSRMKFVTRLKEQKARLYTQKKMIRQGRKRVSS